MRIWEASVLALCAPVDTLFRALYQCVYATPRVSLPSHCSRNGVRFTTSGEPTTGSALNRLMCRTIGQGSPLRGAPHTGPCDSYHGSHAQLIFTLIPLRLFVCSGILTAIRSLLADPNPASPANAEAASLYSSEWPHRLLEL
jgi:hypothetical protein